VCSRSRRSPDGASPGALKLRGVPWCNTRCEMRSGAPAMASTSGRAAYVGTHHLLPMRRSTRAASPLEPPPLGLSSAGRTTRGRRCSHVAWYKRNEWIKYMPEKHNLHDYDDPATFAEVCPLHPLQHTSEVSHAVCLLAKPLPPPKPPPCEAADQ
jgi:hypothetical protein